MDIQKKETKRWRYVVTIWCLYYFVISAANRLVRQACSEGDGLRHRRGLSNGRCMHGW
jgi:hypothetical protein